jgi:hypothetical protein
MKRIVCLIVSLAFLFIFSISTAYAKNIRSIRQLRVYDANGKKVGNVSALILQVNLEEHGSI